MRFGENIDPNAGLKAEEEISAEELEAANEQLQEGFKLPDNPEELTKKYKELFETYGETEIEFFKDIIENAPAEVVEALKKGNTGPLVYHIEESGLKIVGKKLVGLLVFAAISFGAMSFNVSSAEAGENIKKASIESARNKVAVEHVHSGGGFNPNIKGGGKIVLDGKQQLMLKYEEKVNAYNKTINSNGTIEDGNGNMEVSGGIVIDGKRM